MKNLGSTTTYDYGVSNKIISGNFIISLPILFEVTNRPSHQQILNSIRGGSTTTSPISSDNQIPDLKWRMQQQQLLQLRSTFFSEALAPRGIPLTTMLDVSTLDGEKPPEQVDWDCVISALFFTSLKFKLTKQTPIILFLSKQHFLFFIFFF